MWNEQEQETMYCVLIHEYNYSKIIRAFREEAEAKAYKLYHDRNSFEKCFIQEVSLE